MRNGTKKILIIGIIILVILAIAGTVLGYLFIETDTFKSGKELFAKYMQQNKDAIDKIVDSSIYTTFESIKQQEIYESNTTISASYSEGGEISNPINELSLKFKTQKDNDYRYRNAQILFEDAPFLEIEGIREQEIYGIRFPEVKQFLSIRDNGNLAQEANNLGIDEEALEKCISIINNDESLLNEIISKDEIDILVEKYINIIVESFDNATYTKQKDAMITYNNTTIETNAYSATLDESQVQKLIVQLLNSIKVDDVILNIIGEEKQEEFINNIDEKIENLGIDQEIPLIKITVYEQEGITLRTVIDIGLEKITIENSNENGQDKVKIQRNVLNNEEQEEQDIEITKTEADSKEVYNVKANIIEGDTNYTLEFDIQMTANNGILTTVCNFKLTEGIVNVEFTLENIINTMQIDDKVELDENNNVILSDLDEETRENVLNVIRTAVPEILSTRSNELLEKLQIKELIENAMSEIIGNVTEEELPKLPEVPDENDPSTNEPQMTQIEINRFNAKFEFYTGETVSAENVKILLDVVKNNLGSIEITPVETTDNTSTETTNQEEVKKSIKLVIEKDKENLELANQVLEKIEENKKYKVSITYKDTNGMIDYITISEIT